MRLSSDVPERQPVLRFAPSPNGPLHLGHAYSALVAYEMARKLGGRFLLRIEDIDPGRSREDFVAGIYEDLRWLGLTWEEPVLRQSRHIDDYVAAAQRLEAMGVLYRCFATRAEIMAAHAAAPRPLDPEGVPVYPGLHKGLSAREIERRISAAEPFAMRLDMERALGIAHTKLGGAPLEFSELDEHMQPRRVTADPLRWGDVVLQRKDVPTSYHLSVVVDDARQDITHVVRGTGPLRGHRYSSPIAGAAGFAGACLFPPPIDCRCIGAKTGEKRRCTGIARPSPAGLQSRRY